MRPGLALNEISTRAARMRDLHRAVFLTNATRSRPRRRPSVLASSTGGPSRARGHHRAGRRPGRASAPGLAAPAAPAALAGGRALSSRGPDRAGHDHGGRAGHGAVLDARPDDPRPAGEPDLRLLGSGAAVPPDRCSQGRGARDQLRAQRADPDVARRLSGRAGRAANDVDADDRGLHRRRAPAPPARAALPAHRRAQLPGLRAARGSARAEPVHARDRAGDARPDLPLRDLDQPAQPLRRAVHRAQLPAGVLADPGRLLDRQGGDRRPQPGVDRDRVRLRAASGPGPALRRGAARAQPDLPRLRGGRIPQRLLHAGARDRRGRSAPDPSRSRRRRGAHAGRGGQVQRGAAAAVPVRRRPGRTVGECAT